MNKIKNFAKENKTWIFIFSAILALNAIGLFALSNSQVAENDIDYTLASNRSGVDIAALNLGGALESVQEEIEACGYYTLQLESNGDLLFVCHSDAEPTVTPEVTPTSTATAEPTQEPDPTPTIVSSLPLCEDHNDSEWHGLVAEDDSCHYAHTHGDSIATYDDIFGVWPFAETISYPHQTNNENELKHAGYKVYAFDTDGQCVGQSRVPNAECIIAGRLQLHVVGGSLGMNTRVHSYYGQFQVLNPNGTAGTISTGGHSDFGILHCTYKTAHCPLDSDPDSFNLTQPPYRAARVGVGDGVAQWNSGCHNSSQQPCETNQILSYDWVAFDDWGGVNPDNLPELILSNDPERNHSALRFYEFVIMTPPQLGNGVINYEGFTDLNGNIDESCTEVNEACVPLSIENVQAGTYLFRTSVGTSGQPPQDRYYREWDIAPAGENWIEYPN